MNRRNVVLAASAGGLAGVLGLTALSLPAGAGPDPQLPPVAPEQLVESALTAAPPALSGTVRVDNALGLPSLPGGGAADGSPLADGTKTVRVWSDGKGRERASVPSESGETTIVDDGTAVWRWESRDRTVTKAPAHHPAQGADRPAAQDPASLARSIVGRLRQTSEVAVDGTARVAGRDAYELVLTPKPTERTVLREVRLAVDAQNRTPLQVSVLTNGSDQPALRAGFSDVDFSSPDPAMFRFTPPAGARVEEAPHGSRHPHGDTGAQRPVVVGDGWDTVVVGRVPQPAAQGEPGKQAGHADLLGALQQTGKPVRGAWGEGRLISSKAGSALVTADGRVAAGAVPEQVLTEALGTPR